MATQGKGNRGAEIFPPQAIVYDSLSNVILFLLCHTNWNK